MPGSESSNMAHAWRVAALSKGGWCPEVPCLGGPPPWVVALRRAAAGRCIRVACGCIALAFYCMYQFSLRCRVRGHVPPDARRTWALCA